MERACEVISPCAGQGGSFPAVAIHLSRMQRGLIEQPFPHLSVRVMNDAPASHEITAAR